MKLYMKQKVFSFRDKFYIKDEYGEDKYYVEGELISFGKKLHIYDMAGRELALVHEKVLSFLPKFYVIVDGTQVAEIIKKFTIFSQKYTVNGLGWDVNGDFLAHDYEINDNGKSVISIHKQWMTWGDTYEIDILDNQDEVLALAVVLAIDCAILRSQNSAAD